MTPDEKVSAYVLRSFMGACPHSDHFVARHKADHATMVHLYQCPDVRAESADAETDVYYYSEYTMDDRTQFTATITCPHSYSFNYAFAEMGDLPWLLEDL